MMNSEELRKRIAGMQREYMARYGFIGAFPKRFKRLMLLMCAPLPKGIKRRGADLLAENRFAQESRATLVDLEKIKIWDLICGRLKLHELADDRDAMAGSVRQMISILDELCLRVTSVRDPYLMVCISHNLEAFMLPCLPGAGKPNRFRKYSDWDRIRLSYEMFAEAISESDNDFETVRVNN